MKTKPLPDLDPTKGYLTSLTLENIRCFGSPAESLSLTKPGSKTQPARWTVILGANGIGKTTVLRALAYTSPVHQGALPFHPPRNTPALFRTNTGNGYIKFTMSDGNIRKNNVTPIDGGGNYYTMDQEDLVYISTFKHLAGYGAGRAWRGPREDDAGSVGTLFIRDAQVRDPSETLFRYDYREKSEDLNRPSRFEAFKNALTSGILPDVDDLRMGFAANDRPVIEFQTPDGWIALDDMSWGYQVFAAFAADYASRLIEWYPDSKTPLAEPGICLVDELDLHMHPKWQREVIEHLSNVFPATQFIVTVHSPLVVQAAEDANLAVLRRYADDASRVQIDNDVEAIKGWRIDQVLTSDLFGLESSRPPSVAKAMDERTELLAKNAPTPQEQVRLDALEAQAMELPNAEANWEDEARALVLRAAEQLKRGA